jgi:hypothetical protein
MRRTSQPFAVTLRRAPRAGAVAAAVVLWALPLCAAQKVDRRTQERLEEATRKEGEALVTMADAAMAGRPVASDFSLEFRNDFFKAQPGTFVPFTVTVDRSRVDAASALLYVRAARRDMPPPRSKGAFVRYPVDVIFPVALDAPPGQPIRITRGFAVPAGEYDVYIALRERPKDPLVSEPGLKGAVLKQPLRVPDFWTGELTTSTVMLADGIDMLAGPISADDIVERPYVIGDHDVHIAPGSAFRRDRELIAVFLIYNPNVTPDKQFDVQVEYHLFRKDPGAPAEAESPEAGHPPARAGERYVTRTNPQRFNPSLMGVHFDPSAGDPLMAGQGIRLSSFEDGEYRLGITVTDLLSRKTLVRDVSFSVVGS